MKVLFVCEGNTCRSPMLEFMFRDYLTKHGVSDVEVYSRGMTGQEERLSQYCESVLNGHNIPYSAHISKLCELSDVMSADAVIAVTSEISQRLADWINDKSVTDKKVFSLFDVVGIEVQDPYGKGVEEYEKLYGLLSEAIPTIWAFLNKCN